MAPIQVAPVEEFTRGVGHSGVTGTEIRGRNTELGQLGDVGPTELGPHLEPVVAHQPSQQRVGERGGAGRCGVDQAYLVALLQMRGHQPPEEGLGLGRTAIGGVAMVDADRGRIGDHVACDPTLDPDGLLLDFHKLEANLKKIITPLNNTNLNETPPFDTLNPTAENIAKYLADRLAERLDSSLAPHARVHSVSITEAPNCLATYTRPTNP